MVLGTTLTSLVAPVLLFPLEESSLSGGTFELEPGSWRFNPAVIDLLGLPEGWETEWTSRVDAVLRAGGAVTTASRGIQDYLPDLKAGDLAGPLASAAVLREAAKETGLRLHAASALLLAERSPNVRGVLDEISRIPSPGPVLKTLFGGAAPAGGSSRQSEKSRPGQVPAVLSSAQESLLRDAACKEVSVCYGPPGTGKTFTLAAAAIEHAARGEAVLVVCRSRKAADVMENAIDKICGSDLLTLRTGSKEAVRKLRDHIDLMLAGSFSEDQSGSQTDLRRTLKALNEETRGFESQLGAAIRRGRWFDPEGEPRWWHKLGQWVEKQGPGTPLLMDMAAQLAARQQERIRNARASLLREHGKRLDSILEDKVARKVLRQYRDALRRRTSGAWERDMAAIDPKLLLSLFPIWVVESDDVHRVLPLQAGLFPLVMIDEASQCDLASAIPALHRGRRALIAGDPKQLRHVSFMANHRLAGLAERHGISPALRERYHFRDVSLIDAALEASDSVHFLSEHFRSRPELIAFSNASFYRKRLRLMREVPGNGPGMPAAVLRPIGGSRDPGGVNRAELEAVAGFLRSWCSDRQRAGEKRSIGFLSPFRAQVDAFESIVEGVIGREMFSRLVRDHELIASTAHGFQGDERDVMILSLAVSQECPAGVLRFLEREDVFNVSVTRARDHVVVFHSVNRESLPEDSLLARWLGSLEQDHRLPVDDPACRWVGEVADALRREGFTCETGRSAGGIPLDLLVVSPEGKARLAIDLVGQRGRAGERVPLREQLLLQRAGLHLVPLGIHEWRKDPAECLVAIRGLLEGGPH